MVSGAMQEFCPGQRRHAAINDNGYRVYVSYLPQAPSRLTRPSRTRSRQLEYNFINYVKLPYILFSATVIFAFVWRTFIPEPITTITQAQMCSCCTLEFYQDGEPSSLAIVREQPTSSLSVEFPNNFQQTHHNRVSYLSKPPPQQRIMAGVTACSQPVVTAQLGEHVQLAEDKRSLLIAVAVAGLAATTLAASYQYDSEGIAGSFQRMLSEDGEHKSLFPMDTMDWIGTMLTVLGLMIAASGGIGGGGILVPLFILVFGFHARYAIPLSNFCILGSSITNMILNLVKRHPSADRPLVDWDLILVMEPLTMAGAIVGAFLSKILPDWVLTVSLVALLAFTTWKTLEKGLEQWKKESKAFEKERNDNQVIMRAALDRQEEEQQAAESQGLLAHSDAKITDDQIIDELNVIGDVTSSSSSLGDTNYELDELLESERHTPFDRVVSVTVLVGVVIILNLLKGGATFSPLGIECGSQGYWVLTALVFVWVLAVSLYMRNILIDKWKTKKRLRYRYQEGDVEWNPINTLVYPCICFFAGFCAGMFGIGGGIVKGPLMLQMGVHPLVASATCAVMIMFTSVAATTMFIAFGTLTWDYAWFFFVLGLLATVVGQFGVSYLVVKYKRVSLVSLSIGAVVAISTVLMGVQSVFSLVDAATNPNSPKATLCGK